MITAEQITAADTAAAAAEKQLAAAQAAVVANPYSDVTAHKMVTAAQHAARNTANARELREEWDRQCAAQQAAATWEQREKAAAPQIRQAAAELGRSRDTARAAITAAQDALVAAFNAVQAHDVVVARHAAELDTAGLTIENGQDHATGTRVGEVRIRGDWHQPADAGDVAAWLLHRVTEARLPASHHLTHVLGNGGGRGCVDNRRDALVTGLPGVRALTYPKPVLLADVLAAQGRGPNAGL